MKLLSAKLDRSHVRQRQVEGRELSYIEGWFAIAEANRIFGYAGWDRQMVHFERTYAACRGEVTDCGFTARVRIHVRAGGTTIVREGTGFGSACARTPAEAYDRAIKAAETDATKRALATFGNRFGLCLYDKEQRGVEDATKNPEALQASKAANNFKLFSANASLLAGSLSAEGFCTRFRQLIEACDSAEAVNALKSLNNQELARLREICPNLCNHCGVHYADLLARLMERRRGKFLAVTTPIEPPSLSSPPGQGQAASEQSASTNALPPPSPEPEGQPGTVSANNAQGSDASALNAAPPLNNVAASETPAADMAKVQAPPSVPPPSRISGAPRVDKSALAIPSPRRMRDPDHLRAVRKLPCMICERTPCHAHHIKFAQRPGLSIKVSDEFVVPLCSVHHDELHRSVTERGWCQGQGIDPLAIAEKLWRDQRQKKHSRHVQRPANFPVELGGGLWLFCERR